MKAVVGAFNQEKALVGAFSMIVQLQTSQRFVLSSILQTGVQLAETGEAGAAGLLGWPGAGAGGAWTVHSEVSWGILDT